MLFRSHTTLVYKATTSRLNEDIKKIQSDFSVEFRPGAPPPFDFPQNHSHQLEVLLKFAAGSNFILTMSIESILSVSCSWLADQNSVVGNKLVSRIALPYLRSRKNGRQKELRPNF